MQVYHLLQTFMISFFSEEQKRIWYISTVFGHTKKVSGVQNNMHEVKWWLNVHFWVNCKF